MYPAQLLFGGASPRFNGYVHAFEEKLCLLQDSMTFQGRRVHQEIQVIQATEERQANVVSTDRKVTDVDDFRSLYCTLFQTTLGV